MKTKISKKELLAIAPTINAAEFEAFCEKNKIDVSWLDVSLDDYNRDYYNVDLPAYSLNVCYLDGELQSIDELEEE